MKLSKAVRGNELQAHTFQHIAICKTCSDTLALAVIQVLWTLWLLSNTFLENLWSVKNQSLVLEASVGTENLTKGYRYTVKQEQCTNKESYQAEVT